MREELKKSREILVERVFTFSRLSFLVFVVLRARLNLFESVCRLRSFRRGRKDPFLSQVIRKLRSNLKQKRKDEERKPKPIDGDDEYDDEKQTTKNSHGDRDYESAKPFQRASRFIPLFVLSKGHIVGGANEMFAVRRRGFVRGMFRRGCGTVSAQSGAPVSRDRRLVVSVVNLRLGRGRGTLTLRRRGDIRFVELDGRERTRRDENEKSVPTTLRRGVHEVAGGAVAGYE